MGEGGVVSGEERASPPLRRTYQYVTAPDVEYVPAVQFTHVEPDVRWPATHTCVQPVVVVSE